MSFAFVNLLLCIILWVKPSAQTTRTYGRYGGRTPLRV